MTLEKKIVDRLKEVFDHTRCIPTLEYLEGLKDEVYYMMKTIMLEEKELGK